MRLAERRAEENLVFVPLLRRKRSYSAGNTWRHRLKRNQISSHPGLREFRAPACAPNPTPASEQRPSLALKPERAGPRSPEVALGRRGPTSGGDRNRLGVPGLSPPTHAFPNLLGPSGSSPAPVKERGEVRRGEARLVEIIFDVLGVVREGQDPLHTGLAQELVDIGRAVVLVVAGGRRAEQAVRLDLARLDGAEVCKHGVALVVVAVIRVLDVTGVLDIEILALGVQRDGRGVALAEPRDGPEVVAVVDRGLDN